MAHAHTATVELVEKFTLPAKTRTFFYALIGVGLLLAAIGLYLAMSNTGHAAAPAQHGAAAHDTATHGTPAAADNIAATAQHATAAAKTEMAHGEAAHHGPTWQTRFWANFLLNNLLFGGIAILGVFFVAVQTIANAGWYVVVRRIAEAMGGFLPIFFVLMFIGMLGAGQLYHWMDGSAVAADKLLQGKSPWLNSTGFVIRLALYAAIWIGFWWLLRRSSQLEDKEGGMRQFQHSKMLSAIFIILFGLTISSAAWDWIMSIDAHWFSTMFGIYYFASMFVSALSFLTIAAIYLKREGFLPAFNDSHMHDLGKFVFAFCVFWTYIWFCQFMLIWYANMPEETAYYAARMFQDAPYKVHFFMLFLLNFILPFLFLMPNYAKRNASWLTFVCCIILVGHWLDLFVMIMPGTMKEAGSIGLIEVGMPMVYFGVFCLVVSYFLSRAPLIPKQHPYLKETLAHHY